MGSIPEGWDLCAHPSREASNGIPQPSPGLVATLSNISGDIKAATGPTLTPDHTLLKLREQGLHQQSHVGCSQNHAHAEVTTLIHTSALPRAEGPGIRLARLDCRALQHLLPCSAPPAAGMGWGCGLLQTWGHGLG